MVKTSRVFPFVFIFLPPFHFPPSLLALLSFHFPSLEEVHGKVWPCRRFAVSGRQFLAFPCLRNNFRWSLSQRVFLDITVLRLLPPEWITVCIQTNTIRWLLPSESLHWTYRICHIPYTVAHFNTFVPTCTFDKSCKSWHIGLLLFVTDGEAMIRKLHGRQLHIPINRKFRRRVEGFVVWMRSKFGTYRWFCRCWGLHLQRLGDARVTCTKMSSRFVDQHDWTGWRRIRQPREH